MAKKEQLTEGQEDVTGSNSVIAKNSNSMENDDEDDDDEDEDDEDYDPEKKQQDEEVVSEDEDEEGDSKSSKIPDYSTIESTTSQVKTRSQRLNAKILNQTRFIGNFEVDPKSGLVKEQSDLDINSIFDSLKNAKLNDDDDDILNPNQEIDKTEEVKQEQTISETTNSNGPKQIKIQINYTFAGKLITETKMVDENSQEAKAYINSTSSISSATADNEIPYRRSHVNVFRTDPVTKETKELRIKLKRPSLIDRFLEVNGNAKKMRLSTLEKSRLDWASFVDKRKINDELKTHNKGGYLEKQAFLDRMNFKQDDLYLQAKEEEKRRKQQMLNK